MKRFVVGEDRSQGALFPERLDDFITEDNPVQVVEAFIESLPLDELGFAGVEPKDTGRPAYHPSVQHQHHRREAGVSHHGRFGRV